MANTIGFKIALMTAVLAMMVMMTNATLFESQASQSLTVKSHVSMALVAKMATQIEQLQLQHKQHMLKAKEQAMKIERLEYLTGLPVPNNVRDNPNGLRSDSEDGYEAPDATVQSRDTPRPQEATLWHSVCFPGVYRGQNEFSCSKLTQKEYFEFKEQEKADNRLNTGGPSRSSGGFCFGAGTSVEMVDGTSKAIEDVTIGDATRGGAVTGVMQFKRPHLMYKLNGTEVTGGHNVFDSSDGIWKPVKEVASAVRMPRSVNAGPVYDFSCTEHRIFSGGYEYTDYEEHDEIPEITQIELALLNSLQFD